MDETKDSCQQIALEEYGKSSRSREEYGKSSHSRDWRTPTQPTKENQQQELKSLKIILNA